MWLRWRAVATAPYSGFGNNKPTGVVKVTANPNQATTNQPMMLKASDAVEMNLRFPGQYADAETGTFYNWDRYFDQRTGTFTQMDSAGLRAGLNRRLYGDGDSLNRFDPDGRQAQGAAIMCGPGWMLCAAGITGAMALSTPQGRQAAVDLTNKIMDVCTPGDPCDEIRKEIEEWIAAMEKKYLEMQLDRNDLFVAASTGTWEGHVSRYNGMKIRLRKLVDMAAAKGCTVPPRAYEILARPAPAAPTR